MSKPDTKKKMEIIEKQKRNREVVNKRKFKFFKILKFFLDKDLGGIYIGLQFDNLDGFTLGFFT